MPLPYPELHRPGASSNRDCTKLGVNAVVLVLDWLFLGQPAVCKPELGLWLGAELNPLQLAAARTLEESVARWNAEAEVGPEEMGRSASRVEGIEDLLHALREHVQTVPSDTAARCGKLPYRPPCHARAIDPARLRFVGTPTFDPTPLTRAV